MAFSAQGLTGLKSRSCQARLPSGGLRERVASELVRLLPTAAGGSPAPLLSASARAHAVGGHLHFFSRGSRGPPQSGHWVLSLLPSFCFLSSARESALLLRTHLLRPGPPSNLSLKVSDGGEHKRIPRVILSQILRFWGSGHAALGVRVINSVPLSLWHARTPSVHKPRRLTLQALCCEPGRPEEGDTGQLSVLKPHSPAGRRVNEQNLLRANGLCI